MDIVEAISKVLQLALSGIITEESVEEYPALRPIREEQIKAYRIVEDFIVTEDWKAGKRKNY